MVDYQNPYRNINELEEMWWEDLSLFTEALMQRLESANLTAAVGYDLDSLVEAPRISLKKFLITAEGCGYSINTHQFRIDPSLTISHYWTPGPRTVTVRSTFATFSSPDGSSSRRDFPYTYCLKNWGSVWLGYSQLTENTREILLYSVTS